MEYLPASLQQEKRFVGFLPGWEELFPGKVEERQLPRLERDEEQQTAIRALTRTYLQQKTEKSTISSAVGEIESDMVIYSLTSLTGNEADGT